MANVKNLFIALGIATSVTPSAAAAPESQVVSLPIRCSRGPSGQNFRAQVTAPEARPQGTRYKVRIDSFPSGKISHFGRKYVFDMSTQYTLSPGALLVAGSLKIVPNTGSANVRADARAWHDANGIHLLLPTRIPNGGSYTPPSLEFEIWMNARPGTDALVEFSGCSITANAFLVGNKHTTCAPETSSPVVARTRSLAAPSADVRD